MFIATKHLGPMCVQGEVGFIQATATLRARKLLKNISSLIAVASHAEISDMRS